MLTKAHRSLAKCSLTRISVNPWELLNTSDPLSLKCVRAVISSDGMMGAVDTRILRTRAHKTRNGIYKEARDIVQVVGT